MLIEWKDATSYRQGERGKIEPTSYRVTISGHRIWVSCSHTWYPHRWVWVCASLDSTDPTVLGSTDEMDADTAKQAALVAAYDIAQKRIDDFKKFMKETGIE